MSFLLTQEKVENAIDHACQEKNANAARLAELCALRVERITDWQQLADDGYDEEFNANDYLKNKTPWHFGLSIRNQENTKVIGIVSFYVAYSSWSGRILYVDRLQCDGLSDDMEESLLRILADVALKLDCARLTWRVRINTSKCGKIAAESDAHFSCLLIDRCTPAHDNPRVARVGIKYT